MTVKELINKLNEFPKDYLVLVNGYEGGLDDINSISLTKVVKDNEDKDRNKAFWYYGMYNSSWDSKDKRVTDAVVLQFEAY